MISRFTQILFAFSLQMISTTVHPWKTSRNTRYHYLTHTDMSRSHQLLPKTRLFMETTSSDASTMLKSWLYDSAGIAKLERVEKYASILVQDGVSSIDELCEIMTNGADYLEDVGIYSEEDVQRIESACAASSFTLDKWFASIGIKRGRAIHYVDLLAENGVSSIDQLRLKVASVENYLESIGIYSEKDVPRILSGLEVTGNSKTPAPRLPTTIDQNALDMMNAATNGEDEKVRAFLAAGTDVNSRDNLGDSALHDAARKGHESIVRLLLAEGADMNAENKFGYTPLKAAEMFNHTSVADLLRSHVSRQDV